MKKYLLTIILITSLSLTTVAKSIHDITKATNIQIKKTDTLKVEQKRETILPVNEDDKGKIILITQEKKGDDWFKNVLPVLTLLLGIFLNKILEYFSKKNRIRKAGQR